MPRARPTLAFLSCIVVAACNSPEAVLPSEAGSFENYYADTPIIPLRENVRFFERPKMLAEMRKGANPVPEVVLLEREPWAIVLGSESPRFALYSDGQIIYRRKDSFQMLRASEEELHSLKGLLSEVNDPALAGEYLVANTTDQPESSLLLYGEQPVFLSVYGSLDDEQVTSRLPSVIAEAFETVRTFDSARSKPWVPAQFEVMIWPYDHATGPSIKWKDNWPNLSTPSTVQWGDSYSLFFPSTELAGLRDFLAPREPKGTIVIDGRKWSASYRFPFPQEKLWMAPNPEVENSSDER